MARWRLTAPHYLFVTYHPSYTGGDNKVEWEYGEQDRVTGRMLRKRYRVPLELNTKDEGGANYPGQGYIVSNRQDPAYPNDIVFEGDPTLDMIPLDTEAERISAHVNENRNHPIEGLPNELSGDFSERLLAYLEKQLDAASQGRAAQPVSLKGADQAILARLEALEKQNLELQAKLAGVERPEDLDPLPADGQEELPLNPPPVKPAASRPARRV